MTRLLNKVGRGAFLTRTGTWVVLVTTQAWPLYGLLVWSGGFIALSGIGLLFMIAPGWLSRDDYSHRLFDTRYRIVFPLTWEQARHNRWAYVSMRASKLADMSGDCARLASRLPEEDTRKVVLEVQAEHYRRALELASSDADRLKEQYQRELRDREYKELVA
jgi:hypothetical protein